MFHEFSVTISHSCPLSHDSAIFPSVSSIGKVGVGHMTYFGQCGISRFNTTGGLKGICMEWLDPFVLLLSPQKGQAQVVAALSVWDTE